MKGKGLLFLSLFTFSCVASTELVLGGISYHIGEREYEDVDGVYKPYNEVNPTLGLCKDNTCIVASKLSYDNWGVAAYHEMVFTSNEHYNVGVRVGGVVGYAGTPQDNAVVPLVQPVVNATYNKLTVQLGLIPTSPVVLTINAKYRL